MESLFTELTVWHWVCLALILLAVEMMIGTFDLLWVAIASAIAAVYASIVPDSIGSWEYQVGVFAISAVGLIALGRKYFKGLKNPPSSHPTLNDRNASMVGKRAVVTAEFTGGFGRVKINDSEWRAKLEGDSEPSVGQEVEIISGEGSTVAVKLV